jgi:hypothetical protein
MVSVPPSAARAVTRVTVPAVAGGAANRTPLIKSKDGRNFINIELLIVHVIVREDDP